MLEALIGGLAAGILILLVQDYREWRREKGQSAHKYQTHKRNAED